MGREGICLPFAAGLAIALTAAQAWAASLPLSPSLPNEIAFAPQSARFVRLVLRHSQGEPCIDELEVYGPDSDTNLALASNGGKASASSLLPGYAIHQVAHLNDGLYGNSHSWIASGSRSEWAQIEPPQPRTVSRIVFSRDREGQFADRMPGAVEVRLSDDGQNWRSVANLDDGGLLPDGPLTEEALLRYAFAREDASVRQVDATDPCLRVLRQMDEMIARLGKRGLDISRERAELADSGAAPACPNQHCGRRMSPLPSPLPGPRGEGVQQRSSRTVKIHPRRRWWVAGPRPTGRNCSIRLTWPSGGCSCATQTWRRWSASCSSSGRPMSRRTITATSSIRRASPAAACACWISRGRRAAWRRDRQS